MIGPKRTPKDFGFRAGDTHIVVNDSTETAKAYNHDGKLLWEIPALARGQGTDYEFKYTNTDTPPGLYKIGQVYNDYARVGDNPGYDRTLMAYGWISFDLVELEGQETVGQGHGPRSNACCPPTVAFDSTIKTLEIRCFR